MNPAEVRSPTLKAGDPESDARTRAHSQSFREKQEVDFARSAFGVRCVLRTAFGSLLTERARAQLGEADGGASPGEIISDEIYRAHSDLSHRVKALVTKARPRISTELGKPRLRVYARYIGRRAQTGPWSRQEEFTPRQP